MNVALNEANALQKRIDELQEKASSLTPKPVKERKDLDELRADLDNIQQQVNKLAQKVDKEESAASQEAYTARQELQQQINVLTATRDVCLQKAGKQGNPCYEGKIFTDYSGRVNVIP